MQNKYGALSALTLIAIATPARAEVHDAAEIVHGVIFVALTALPFLVMLAFGLWLLIVSLRARGTRERAPAPPQLFSP